MVKAITRRYERWIREREEYLCFRATNRVVRDFEWGLEWTHKWPVAQRNPKNGEHPGDYMAKLNDIAMLDSDEFFGYEVPGDFDLRDGILRFHSPVHTPYPENNLVHAQWFPANAALLAAEILAANDAALYERLAAWRAARTQEVLDQKLGEEQSG